MALRTSDLRIGISGWTYAPWRGPFFPKNLPQRRELEFAATRLNSIEINGSFYSLQTPASYRKWYDATPDDFVFSLKGPQFISHIRRLRNIEEPIANFFASGIFELREKLGPILWQFPPNFKFDPDTFEAFLKYLPRSTADAATLAKGHSSRVKQPSVEIDRDRPMRYAVEIRHESFKTPRFIDMLRLHRVSLVFADAPARWPYMEDLTADFVYIRLHGEEELYASGYETKDIERWAKRITAWRAGKALKGPLVCDKPARKIKSRDVYIYFDNDKKVLAPVNAQALAKRLKLSWADEHELRAEPRKGR